MDEKQMVETSEIKTNKDVVPSKRGLPALTTEDSMRAKLLGLEAETARLRVEILERDMAMARANFQQAHNAVVALRTEFAEAYGIDWTKTTLDQQGNFQKIDYKTS